MRNPRSIVLIEHYRESERGFSLMELLVAATLSTIVISILVGAALFNHQGYYEDVIRIAINSNLRSASDIVSMNIRQAGEDLTENFPALLLQNGVGAEGDVLKVRRNLVSDVLTVCTSLAIGATNLYVSNTAVTDPECIYGNVTGAHNQWMDYLAAQGTSVRVYLYNTLTKTGEFVMWSAGTTSSGAYLYTISPTAAAYPALTSNVYLLEEYEFSLDTAGDTLDLVVGQESGNRQRVAFNILTFQVQLKMTDGTTKTSLTATDPTYTWKDIKHVRLDMSGQDQRQDRIFTAEFAGEYFPRNVLSE